MGGFSASWWPPGHLDSGVWEGATLEATQGQIFSRSPKRCYLREVAFEWKLTKESILLPLGCLQGGLTSGGARPTSGYGRRLVIYLLAPLNPEGARRIISILKLVELVFLWQVHTANAALAREVGRAERSMERVKAQWATKIQELRDHFSNSQAFV